VYTCPNASCRKVFSTPLRTLNLQPNSTEPYYACPHCLTKIEEPPKITSKPQKIALEKNASVEKQNETKTEPSRKDEVPPTCHFHLGYLSERAPKERIPDECLVCSQSLACMLKKMRA
jgi:hypothetical protein